MRTIIRVLTIILMLFFANINLYAQKVVSANGGTATAAGTEVSWTLGELAIETFSSGANILTQGFHQSKLTATALTNLLFPDIELKVFPNPTQDFVLIHFNDLPDQASYFLFNLTGKLLENKNMTANETRLDMENYPSGTYVLKLYSGNQEAVQEFKIIKQ